MSLRFVKKDYFSIPSDVVVNPVNCRAVMGKGLALEFKKRYPEMFDKYHQDCKDNLYKPGSVVPFYLNEGKSPSIIVNFATKDDWKYRSKLSWIDLGLSNFAKLCLEKDWSDKQILLPALGCGNGGLDWDEVKKLMLLNLCQIELSGYQFTACAPF